MKQSKYKHNHFDLPIVRLRKMSTNNIKE